MRGPFLLLFAPALLDLDENDDQGEQRKGLNERQAEHEEGENSSARARITGKCFDGRADGFALAQSAQTGREPHADTCTDGSKTGCARSAIRKHRNGKAKDRQCDKHVLKLLHSSPASLGLAASGWLRLTVLAPSRLQPSVGPKRKLSPAESF
jgi:hypothetical protein